MSRKRRALGKRGGFRCSRCGKRGSIQSKWVLNEQKRRYEPYFYTAHFSMNSGHRKISWCYLGKRRDLKKPELRAFQRLERKRAKRAKQRSE